MKVDNYITYDKETYELCTKKDLVKAISNLSEGERIDWSEVDGEDISFSYSAEVMNWLDSTVLLIGGYGMDVLGRRLEGDASDIDDIGDLVDAYFKLRFIDDESPIAILVE